MNKHNTYTKEELQSTLSKIVNHVGQYNSITAKEMCEEGIVVRRKVNILRHQGYAICSCKNGYYMANNSTDIQDTIDFIDAHQNEMCKTIDALKSTQDRWKRGNSVLPIEEVVGYGR